MRKPLQKQMRAFDSGVQRALPRSVKSAFYRRSAVEVFHASVMQRSGAAPDIAASEQAKCERLCVARCAGAERWRARRVQRAPSIRPVACAAVA